MRVWGLVPLGFLAAGAVLVVWAALQGGAQLAVVVILPVIFGRSLDFGVGVLLLLVGFFTLPLAFGDSGGFESDAPRLTEASSAGLVLIGPIPIFFGSWSHASRRTRILAAVIGAAAVVGTVLLLLWVRT